MDNIWQRLLNILEAQNEKVAISFHEGATEADFEALEHTIKAKLPEDFKAFYRIHNGQTDKYVGLFYSSALLPINEIIHNWKHSYRFLQEVQKNPRRIFGSHVDDADFEESTQKDWQDAKEIQDVWWHPLWIRFTDDTCGDGYSVDLAPTSEGQMGQIIWYFHDDKSFWEAPSFSKWIEEYVEALEKGEYVYSQDDAAFVKCASLASN